MRKISRGQQVVSQILLALTGLFVLLPVWSLLRLALDGDLKSFPTELSLLPARFTLEVFVKVWHNPAQALSFTQLLGNSLIVAGGAALGAAALGAGMAYAFARFRFTGRKSGLFGLLVGALLPPVALMTPLYVLFSALGVRTTLIGLMLVYTAVSLPFCIWNLRAAFQAVSRELEEAAFLDGASAWTAFRCITLPLALPSIAVAVLVAFLGGYTEFAIGWLFVERASNVTLAMALWGLRSLGTAPWSEVSALALLMSLPVVILFLVLQRTLMDRFLLGGAPD